MRRNRDENARALSHRASNGHVAVAVDTRPKVVKARKGKGSYDRRALKASACRD